MRLTPAQIAVRLICGEEVPRFRAESMADCIRAGHDFLVRISGVDFGYDLQAWHDHLKESKQGGYTYGRNIELPRIMKAALDSTDWQATVRSLTLCDDGPGGVGQD
jgi:hypothetical protein